MNGKDVMDALANIDDDLILDAKSQPRAIPRWLKWGSMAVCICCAVLLTLLCVEKLRSGGTDTGNALAPGSEQTEPAFPEASSAEEETAIPEESSADEEAAVPEETELEISLDSQGNLSCIQWGTALTEAQALFPEAALSEDTLSLTGTCFDYPVTLSLQFSQVSWSDEPILYGAAMTFSEEADLDRLSEEMDQLFGPVETQGETQNGEIYDLQEADYYWHGSGYVYELVDTDALQAYISAQGDGSDWMEYILRTMSPVTITLAREDYTLNLDAKYAVELEQISATATDTETAATTSNDLEDTERTTITDAVLGLSIEVPVEYQADIVCNSADTVLFSFYDPVSNAAMGGGGGGFVWSICAYPIEEADLYVGDDLCPTDGIRLVAPEGFVLGQTEEYIFAVILPSGVQYLPDVAESKSSYQEYCKAGCAILSSFLSCNGITGSDGWEEHYMGPVNARDGT